MRKSETSLKCSASRTPTEASKPRCVPTPAQQQQRCSPNNPFASAMCTASKEKGFPWSLFFYLQGRIYGEKHWTPIYLPKELQWCTIPCAATHLYFTVFPYREWFQIIYLEYLCRFQWYHFLPSDASLAMLVNWVTALLKETCCPHADGVFKCPENPWQILTHPLKMLFGPSVLLNYTHPL